MKHFIILRSAALLLTGAFVAVGFGACNSALSTAQSVAVSDVPPPALPVYSQPPIPAQGYVWTPGYWGWNDSFSDYYWVPGTWVQPPQVGLVWTPGYWAFVNGRYAFNQGYWGSQVGFYGGIDYGYGYSGAGYQGGRWQGDNFYYNTAVNNVSGAPIRDVYKQTVVDNREAGRVSFNGGARGVQSPESSAGPAVEGFKHFPPTPVQNQHVQLAQTSPSLRASVNHGRPAIAATSRPAVFEGTGVITSAAAAAPYHPLAVTAERSPEGRSLATAEGPSLPRAAIRPMILAARPMQSAPEARSMTPPVSSGSEPRDAERPAPAPRVAAVATTRRDLTP